MIFYHFTAREYLDAIQGEGLTKGDVPLTATTGVNAVWLTTDKNPAGHGLSDGGELTCEMRVAYQKCFGVMPREGDRFPNKRAVRITVLVSSTDRNLYHWPKWGRKRLHPQYYEVLNKTGGGKTKTWWLYFGTIPPSCFHSVELL
jgi:hypothetical protein